MSITDPQFEDVVVPQGTFIGWGKPGQVITGEVASFSPEGALDFNGNPCPQLVLVLTTDVDNYRDKGATRDTIAKGELVTITAGQVALKQAVNAANFNTGDIARISFDGTHKSSAGNDVKDFTVQVARGVAKAPAAASAPDAAGF